MYVLERIILDRLWYHHCLIQFILLWLYIFMSLLNEEVSNHTSMKTHVHQARSVWGLGRPPSLRFWFILNRSIIWILITWKDRRLLGMQENQFMCWRSILLIIWVSVKNLQLFSLPGYPLLHSFHSVLNIVIFIFFIFILLSLFFDNGYAFLLFGLDFLYLSQKWPQQLIILLF